MDSKKPIKTIEEDTYYTNLPYLPADGQILIKRKTSYFSNYRDRVALVKAEKISGINSHSEERWYRWRNTDSYAVRRNSAGKFILTGKLEKRYTGAPYLNNFFQDTEFNYFFQKTFGTHLRYETLYPLADHYGLTYDMDGRLPVGGWRASMKETDLKSQVAYLFGKTRCRKDLMRAVANSHPHAIMLAREFRGLVPVDWLAHFLRVNAGRPQQPVTISQIAGMRKNFYTMDPRSFRDILLSENPLTPGEWYEISDIVQMAREPFQGRVRSFHELHEEVFGDLQRFAYAATPRESKSIPMTPLAQRLSTIPGVVLPTTTEDLYAWGSEMRNCIGSYGYVVAREKRNSELGGIVDETGKMIANFEIHNGELKQFLGKCNTPVRAYAIIYEREFKRLGIKIPERYWGSNE